VRYNGPPTGASNAKDYIAKLGSLCRVKLLPALKCCRSKALTPLREQVHIVRYNGPPTSVSNAKDCLANLGSLCHHKLLPALKRCRSKALTPHR
jgi:hypothetical protein